MGINFDKPTYMKHKKITAVLRGKFKRIDRLAARTAAGFGEGDIHRFRLEVKRYRAFLRLIATANKNMSNIKLTGRLHRFYRAVGRIRNLQVQRDLLVKFAKRKGLPVPEDCLQFIDREIHAAKSFAGPILSKKRPFKKGRRQILVNGPDKLSRAQKEEFVRNEMGPVITAPMPSLAEDEYLHGIRKSLKDLLYTWPWLGKKNIRSIDHSLPARGNMRKVEALLGDWLDRRFLLALLQQEDFRRSAGPKEAKFIQEMEQACLPPTTSTIINRALRAIRP
jgi:CHAD domain-containing protein